MTCDQATELLPWLMNGTLAPAERDEVRRHLESCTRCREALAETRQAWNLFSQHLPAEALVALAWGETPAGIDPALARQHLASCPECAAELELTRTSRRLEDEDNVAVFPGPRRREVSERGYRGWRASALAAGLAGVVAATGWYNSAQQLRPVTDQPARPAVEAPEPAQPAPDSSAAELERLQRETEQLRQAQAELDRKLREAQEQIASASPAAPAQPRINAPILDLDSRAERERGGEGETTKLLSGETGGFLSLHPAGEANAPSYEIEITDSAGKVVWKAAGLRFNPDSASFQVILPGGFLSRGNYQIRIYGIEGGRRAGGPEVFDLRVQ
jgi:hypothetical protein